MSLSDTEDDDEDEDYDEDQLTEVMVVGMGPKGETTLSFRCAFCLFPNLRRGECLVSCAHPFAPDKRTPEQPLPWQMR